MSRPPENKPANLPVFPECDVSLDAPDDNHAPFEIGPTVFAVELDGPAEPRTVAAINRNADALRPALVDELDDELQTMRRRCRAAEAEALAWLDWARELATFLDVPWQSHTQPGPMRSRIDERAEDLRDAESRLDAMGVELRDYLLSSARVHLVAKRSPEEASALLGELLQRVGEDLRAVLDDVADKMRELRLSRDRLGL